MTGKDIIVVDEVGAIVSALSGSIPEFLPDGTRQERNPKTLLQILQDSHPEIEGIFYQYGPGLEVSETLAQKDMSQTQISKKYPLIVLFSGFEERIDNSLGIYEAANINIVIVYQTTTSMKTSERYDRNFRPVLYPIYHAFITQLEQSGRLMWNNGVVAHRKTDKPYYDPAKDVNGGNDFLDAIEITDLNLSFYNQIC